MKKTMHMWTKSELKELVKIWEGRTAQEVADSLGVEKDAMQQVVFRLRRAGVKITRKHRTGYLDLLIKEVAKELK